VRRVRGALALGIGAASLLAAPAAVRADRVHVVRPGDSLWRIAAAVTGDPTLWPLLYRANRDQIKDPSILYPGQRLTIPDFAAPARTVQAPNPASPAGN
jgi:nucleoid-associated protein YgaU